MILVCPRYSQRFVSVFTEMIDWADGDDPQYRMVLPITGIETDDLIKQRGFLTEAALDRLGPGRRFLRRDDPKGAARYTFYAKGLIGPHD